MENVRVPWRKEDCTGTWCHVPILVHMEPCRACNSWNCLKEARQAFNLLDNISIPVRLTWLQMQKEKIRTCLVFSPALLWDLLLCLAWKARSYIESCFEEFPPVMFQLASFTPICQYTLYKFDLTIQEVLWQPSSRIFDVIHSIHFHLLFRSIYLLFEQYSGHVWSRKCILGLRKGCQSCWGTNYIDIIRSKNFSCKI